MPRHTQDEDERDEPGRPGMRLQKYLAAAGLGSRRKCEELITAGRVTVDGEPVAGLGQRIDPRTQIVRVDEERVRPQPKRYYAINKPAGYLCTNSDPAGRPRVIDLLPPGSTRLYTVGRLDEESEGLILVTNDGELAQRLAHPRFHVPRVYHVQVAGRPTRETLDQLKAGFYFTEGKFRVDRVRIIGNRGKSCYLEVEMRQGRNREIRRLLARVGHKVIHLKRVSFGPIRLGSLGYGRFRPLRPPELQELRDQTTGAGKPATAPKAPRPKRSPERASDERAGRKTGSAPRPPRPARSPRPKVAKSAPRRTGRK